MIEMREGYRDMHRTEICKMDAEARKEGASWNVGCIFGSKLPSLDGNITMKAMIVDTQLHITMYVAKCYSSNLSDMEKEVIGYCRNTSLVSFVSHYPTGGKKATQNISDGYNG